MARLPDPRTRDRWSQLIQQQQQSDGSIAEFCDLNDVSTASFYLWRRKLCQDSDSAREFLAVELTQAGSDGPDVRVHFPFGTRLELDPADTPNLHLVLDRLTRTHTAEQGR